MAIAAYQILIASIILVAAFLSRKKFYITLIGASLWTITHIFVAWLMALQFGTILVTSLLGLAIVNISEFIERIRFRRLQKISLQNRPSTLYKLGYMFEKGKGVSADKEQAKKHYATAELLGSTEAKEALKRIKTLEDLPDTIFSYIAMGIKKVEKLLK